MSKINHDQLIQRLVDGQMYSNTRNLKTFLRYLFGDFDFQNKRFIDIGGGAGLGAFYAAFRGAETAICLEPDAEGSIQGNPQRFDRFKELTNSKAASFVANTLQGYTENEVKFDLVLLKNSINHLDEEHCVTLLDSKESQEIYSKLFDKLYDMTAPGGKIIILDCPRSNFYSRIGLKSPFQKTIEWEKHQSPTTWASLLEQSGFKNPKISWSSFNSLGKMGRVLFGNRIASYFLLSHFRLEMNRPG